MMEMKFSNWFGTWQMPNDEHTAEIVEYAIKNGYRHIIAATYKKKV